MLAILGLGLSYYSAKQMTEKVQVQPAPWRKPDQVMGSRRQSAVTFFCQDFSTLNLVDGAAFTDCFWGVLTHFLPSGVINSCSNGMHLLHAPTLFWALKIWKNRMKIMNSHVFFKGKLTARETYFVLTNQEGCERGCLCYLSGLCEHVGAMLAIYTCEMCTSSVRFNEYLHKTLVFFVCFFKLCHNWTEKDDGSLHIYVDFIVLTCKYKVYEPFMQDLLHVDNLMSVLILLRNVCWYFVMI